MEKVREKNKNNLHSDAAKCLLCFLLKIEEEAEDERQDNLPADDTVSACSCSAGPTLKLLKDPLYCQLYLLLSPYMRAHPPVVFAWVHLCVLHPELLGKQHEGVHWPLALSGRGTITSCCAGILAFGWLLTRSVGVTGTVGICRF